jgi:hypothetical protein
LRESGDENCSKIVHTATSLDTQRRAEQRPGRSAGRTDLEVQRADGEVQTRADGEVQTRADTDG